MDNLSFFPTVTEKMLDDCGCVCNKYVFTYEFSGKRYGLQQKGNSTIKLSDPLEIWKVETEGVAFEKCIKIAYPELLYGKNGVACKGAELGIGIIWTNKSLAQTGCILPIDDYINPQGRTCKFEHTFLPGEIAGDLELSVIAYIKSPAREVLPEETVLMNEAGVSVGEIETVVLDFNSIYMEFPVEEVNSDKEPLWWVEFSQWEDPKVDAFSKDNLCLYLNTHYEACPMVGEKIKNIDLLVDILAQTYFLVFQKLAENDNDMRATREDLDLENNSICSIMHQFILSCPEELHYESSEKLLKSIQINVRMLLTEGEDE